MNLASSARTFDVAVIGGGLVGCAIARDLAATDLSVAIVEARSDVGDGTSKANTAILHTGFDAKPGTLESRLVARGYDLLGAYADEVGIPVERTGALLVAWTQEELDALPGLKAKAEENGYRACRLVGAEHVYATVPRLGAGALGGLTVPGESIICTWTTNLALATEAKLRGAAILTGHRVTGIRHEADRSVLETSEGDVAARWVINAAGLGADVIDQEFGYSRFTVTPRRGELLVFDKLTRPMVPAIVLPVPSSLGKGVLVSPTIYGNVMVGPTAEDLEDRTATGTSVHGFDFLFGKGETLMPDLMTEEVTASYSGLRAAIDSNDYLIDLDAAQRYVLVGGIRSTGLTAAMAIAEHVLRLLADGTDLDLTARDHLPDPPRMPNIGEAFPRPYQDTDQVASDPEYGHLVCFCERVSAGEIRDALCSAVPPADLDGLRRRTRAMNGRCQGFFCGAEVAEVLQGRPRGSENSPDAQKQPKGEDRHVRVLIVGGGPAGLAAATALAATGQVVVLDREARAGGIPRHSDHSGYGVRDLKRVMTGPTYARYWRRRAVEAGAEIVESSMATDWAGERTLWVTSPTGRYRISAEAVVLATGARERPRSARRIPGDRPAGVLTTGQVQNLVHLKRQNVGTRAVVVGAELVSWSAVMTLKEAGCRTVALITRYEKSESYAAFRLGGRILFRTPVRARTEIVRIDGRDRVEAVLVRDLDTGEESRIECDTVVTTGDWIPDNELFRAAGVELDPDTLGPVVDAGLRTSVDGVFAAGNVIHPVDTADVAALDGTHVAAAVLTWLEGNSPARGVRITTDKSLRWVAPQYLDQDGSSPARNRLLAWSDHFVTFPVVEARQNGTVVATRRVPWNAAPGRVFRIPADLLAAVDPTDGSVEIGLRRNG